MPIAIATWPRHQRQCRHQIWRGGRGSFDESPFRAASRIAELVHVVDLQIEFFLPRKQHQDPSAD